MIFRVPKSYPNILLFAVQNKIEKTILVCPTPGGVAFAFRPTKGPAGRLWCKRFEVEPSRRREVALDHAARTAFQILGAVLPLVPSLPSLN
jgi:hypothetical protein